MFNSETHPAEPPKIDHLEGIRELIRDGETVNLPHWGDGKFVVGDGEGKWHYDGFVRLFRALHEAMRAIDPSIPAGLPAHCLDPEVIARFFRIRLEDMDLPEKMKTEPLKAIDTPYLTIHEGAAYLRTTVQGIYSLVKRGRLHPMPGRGKLLFTREALDRCMTTRRRRRR